MHLIRQILALSFYFSGSALQAADYYVRPTGNDEAAGLAPETAWKTIERLARAKLHPGDRILFEGGQGFKGHLTLGSDAAGEPGKPVIIDSFGKGRATILAGKSNGIQVESAGSIHIQNLKIEGAGATASTGYGILFENRLGGFTRLRDVLISNVEVSGFGIFGILITGDKAGYEQVRVDHCVLHDNLRGGMEIAGRFPYDSTLYSHANVHVTNCDAFKNTGDPNYMKNHSGSGIVLYQVDGGTIDRCKAWENGELCRSKTGGGVGIWTSASRRVIIQNCESFSNKTSGSDGGGFDIDGGCEECILQYNYSHDNDGPGLMVYTYPYASYKDRDNIVRFNISENDARRGGRYAGLWVQSDGKRMDGLKVYNNTVVIGSWSKQAAFVNGEGVQAHFQNNLFISSGTARSLRADHPSSSIRFENNLYWQTDGPVKVQWNETDFTSLAEWRLRTNQETINGTPTGFFQDPKLINQVATPGKAVLTPPGSTSTGAFVPTPDSPVLKAGINLFPQITSGKNLHDYFGTPLPARGPWALGAVQSPASATP